MNNNNDYEFRLVNYFLSIFARIAITNKEVFEKFKKSFDELETLKNGGSNGRIRI